MAEREFQQFSLGLLKQPVRLYGVVSVGGSGAVTFDKWNYSTRAYEAAPTATGVSPYQTGESGIKSVVRTGTGAWTITLQDKYQRLLGATFSQSTGSGATTVVAMAVDDSTDVTAATPVVKVVFSSAAGTAADPASGDDITVILDLQNSGTL